MGVIRAQTITEDRASGAQVIDGSLKFDSEKSTHLTRTPSSAGNRRTWTWSGWVKRTALQSGTSPQYELFSVDSGGNDNDYFQLGIRADRIYIAAFHNPDNFR